MDRKPEAFNTRRVVGILAGILLIVGFWPSSYLASPRWQVRVVAEDGRPLPGISVCLTYQNYSSESHSHQIALPTDGQGQVVFPSQYHTTSFLRRMFYVLLSARAGVHASFGRHAYVIANGDGYEGVAVSGGYVADWNGAPDTMESRIVARKTRR